MKRERMVFLLTLVVGGLLAFTASAAVPGTMSFQGLLTTSEGSPITGAANLVFTICADSACAQQLWTENQNGILISKGLFAVRLGAANPLPATVFDGSLRWLSVTVEGQAISKRFPLQSVPYSYHSVNSDTATYAKSGASTDCGGCDNRFVNTDGPDSVTVTEGTAFLARSNSSVNSSTYGVRGYAVSSVGGPAFGGYFASSGVGSGTHYGVSGKALGSTSDTTIGVLGRADNTGLGDAIAGDFYVGDYGVGRHYGIRANAVSSNNQPTYGIEASVNSSWTGAIYAGKFDAQSGGTGNHYGVYSQASGTADPSTFGVWTEATNSSTGDVYGGYFRANSSGTGNHYAVSANAYGSSTSSTYAYYGSAQNSSTGSLYGGYFKASTAGTGWHYAVYGDCSSASGNNYAGYFNGAVIVGGSLAVIGSKSAVVELSRGDHRAVYCQESPENWFEDFGEGQLVNGNAHVDLDSLYLRTVTVDATNPMKVFVQLEGDCKGVYVDKGATDFDVRELQGGTSNVSFSYRVVAKRKGFEDMRMATVKLPPAEE